MSKSMDDQASYRCAARMILAKDLAQKNPKLDQRLVDIVVPNHAGYLPQTACNTSWIIIPQFNLNTALVV